MHGGGGVGNREEEGPRPSSEVEEDIGLVTEGLTLTPRDLHTDLELFFFIIKKTQN